MIDLVLCFLFVSIFFIWRSRARHYPANFPPGPRHFVPFIGDPLFAIGVRDGVSGFRRMHKKYGPIVGYSFGGMKVVSINDFLILQQVIEAYPIQSAYKRVNSIYSLIRRLGYSLTRHYTLNMMIFLQTLGNIIIIIFFV